MKASDLVPEILSPYDVRHVPKEVPAPGIFDCPTVPLCINNFWASHLDGLLERLIYRDAWTGTEEEVDRAIGEVNKLLAALKENNMSCCCDEPTIPPQYRWTSDGTLQVSRDGGETWEDDPADDPRNLVTLLPGPGLADGDKCTYAANISHEVKKQVDFILNELANGKTAADIAPAVIALAIALGLPSGGLSLFLIVVYGLISAFIALADRGLEGSFDTTFWEHYQCFWFCVISDDGEVTDAMIETVKGKVSEYFGTLNPLAAKVMNDTIGTMGAKELTNSARMNLVADADCSDCDCEEFCGGTWAIHDFGGTVGTIVAQTETTITIRTGAPTGEPKTYVMISSSSGCCHFTHIQRTAGSGQVNLFWSGCGDGAENVTDNVGSNVPMPDQDIDVCTDNLMIQCPDASDSTFVLTVDTDCP